VQYSELRPGRYVFRVTARNPESDWLSDPAVLVLRVQPLYWQTWWFAAGTYAAAALALAGLGRWVSSRRFRRRLAELERQRQLEEERSRIARDLHDDLGSSLTQIAYWSDLVRRQGHVASPTPVLQRISETAREAVRGLDQIVWILKHKNDSLDHLANYLAHFDVDRRGRAAPVLVSEPQATLAFSVQPLELRVRVNGTAPFHYQWWKAGQPLPGQQGDTLILSPIQTTHAGNYSVAVRNLYGEVITSPASISVATSIPLAAALDATNLTWFDDLGSSPWVGQTLDSHDGSGAGRSGPIGDDEWSVIAADVTGPGVITFWWKVSIEEGWDELWFDYGAPAMALGPLKPDDSGYAGEWGFTDGYDFTPNADWLVTAVRSCYGLAVSIWQDDGTLVAKQPVAEAGGTWSETPLPSPVVLSAGVRYLVGAHYPPGGTNYYLTNAPPVFLNGTVGDGWFIDGDAMPWLSWSRRWPLVDLAYQPLVPANLPVTPANASFAAGTWSGNLTIDQPLTGLRLRVDDGLGHQGVSPPITVRARFSPPLLTIPSGSPLRLQVQAEVGATLSLLTATSLAGPWETNTQLTLVQPQVQLVLTNSGEAARFFRVLQQ
jgi:hypothetical protein